MNGISGWAIRGPVFDIDPVFTTNVRFFKNDKPFFLPTNLPRRQETWHSVSLVEQLKKLSRLVDDWDGYGAAGIEGRAIAHAQNFLPHLHPPPDYFLPSVAGTVLVEWDGMLGRASLELGIDTFSFYTSPIIGDSILLGGTVQALDVGDINFAVAAVAGNVIPHSVEGGHWRHSVESVL